MADPTIKAVEPYDHVSDVDVVITVRHPRPVIGLGNLLVLNPKTASTAPAGSGSTGSNTGAGSNTGSTPAPAAAPLSDNLTVADRQNGILLRKTDTKTGAVYREYKNADAVAVDYGENSPVYKKAQTYFAQDNHSDRIAVLDYDPAKAYDSLKPFWQFNWTFAILSNSTIDDSTVQLSNIFEANKDHFLVIQASDTTPFSKFYGQNYTIALKHDTAEAMDAAIVGAVATLTVGSVTWKFKLLKGITPEVLTSTELSAINTAHAIAYIDVDGTGETSEGTTMSGEYIDTIHGIMWVNVNMEQNLEKFLQENGKVEYGQRGITEISGVAIQTLEQAYAQRIIATNETTGKADYSVTTTPRSDQPQADISARHYGGLSFEYHADGAIHTITVHGTVDSDTILS